MTDPTRHEHTPAASSAQRTKDPGVPAQSAAHIHEAGAGHGGHGWMMLVCCIPMLVVVLALVVTGVAGLGALIYAGVCLGMMWLMMRLMPGGH